MDRDLRCTETKTSDVPFVWGFPTEELTNTNLPAVIQVSAPKTPVRTVSASLLSIFVLIAAIGYLVVFPADQGVITKTGTTIQVLPQTIAPLVAPQSCELAIQNGTEVLQFSVGVSSAVITLPPAQTCNVRS